jgi:Protein involved in chromosome segregation, interacts with SMC proteins
MNSFRLNEKAWTFIYACALVLTAVLLFGINLLRPGHLWISLEALALAETAVYGTVMFGFFLQKRNGSLSIGYSAFVTVSALYLLAAAVIVVLFSLLFNVSTLSYFLIHIFVLAAAGIAAGLAAIVFRKSVQEDNAASQTELVQSMQNALRDALRQLRGGEEGELLRELERLEEKVRFSDPVSHPTMLDADRRLVIEAEQLAADIRYYTEQPERTENSSFGRRIRVLSDMLTDRNEKLIQLK